MNDQKQSKDKTKKQLPPSWWDGSRGDASWFDALVCVCVGMFCGLIASVIYISMLEFFAWATR